MSYDSDCWKCGARTPNLWWDHESGLWACRLCGARQHVRWLPQRRLLNHLSRGRPPGVNLVMDYLVLTS